jgi:biopolymer transport protein ExbD
MDFKMENKLLTSFNFSSLTDIVLLLMIFFLLTSSFVVSSGLKVQLPKSESGEPQRDHNIIVTLTDKDELYLNNHLVTKPELASKLNDLLKGSADQIVVIYADNTVSLQSTVNVIDIAKGVGATRFMIATQPVGSKR